MIDLRRTTMAILALGAMLVAFPTIPAHASTCTKYGWVKAVILHENVGFPDNTGAEVREQGWWNTSGDSGCYQRGLYNQHHTNNVDYSYCYHRNGPGSPYYWERDWCHYWLQNQYWYNDGTRNRYVQLAWTIASRSTWYDYAPGGPIYGNLEIYGRFIVRYDGQYAKSCWTKGQIPPSSYLHCHGGRGDGRGS